MEASDTNTQRNYYDDLATRALGQGHPLEEAIERAASAYLDGKPQTQGKRKLTRRERDNQFWLSRTVKDCPTSAWSTEPMVLARPGTSVRSNLRSKAWSTRSLKLRPMP